MDRRHFAKSLATGALAAIVGPRLARASVAPIWSTRTPDWLLRAEAALPEATVTGIRIFEPPIGRGALINQSRMVILVDTDIGVTGIGEGGTPDLVESLARSVIGKNPFEIERIWQYMYMDQFYSPGREKIHALGGLDMALWDIKGKALDVPLHQMFGGMVRNYIELYTTSGLPRDLQRPEMSLRERAAATMEAGYRVFRVDAQGTAGYTFGGPIENRVFDTRVRVPAVAEACREIREGVGPDGNWCIDFHQKLDYGDTVELCRMIEDYRPFFVEDPLREEQFLDQIPKLRMMTTCPLAPGEQWGQRWTFNKLVENRDIDWVKATLPNVGGISEMLKIMAMCETHTVGISPHFCGPIATAALIQTLGTFPGQVLMEFNHQSGHSYLPEFVDFRDGKLWPNLRPGLGLTLDMNELTLIREFTEGTAGPGGNTYFRPDGSPTHW